MGVCRQLRPLLDRVVDGEATPDEALVSARHLPQCTACRIRLARARRLAEMLEQGLDDPLQVGEEFVQNVMARLPEHPPRKRRPRGLTR